MTDFVEHLPGEQSTEDGPAHGGTRRAQPAALAAEGHQELAPTVVANNACEAVLVDAAVEGGENGVLDAGAPEAVTALKALFPRTLDLNVVALDELIEGGISRAAGSAKRSAVRGQGDAPPAWEDDTLRPKLADLLSRQRSEGAVE